MIRSAWVPEGLELLDPNNGLMIPASLSLESLASTTER